MERSITADRLTDHLEDLVKLHGPPAVLRSDNGPEFISQAMADWAGTRTGLFYIPPGSPWLNGYVESFNSRIRDECLNINSFYSLLHARVVISDWKTEYNTVRRHSALGYQAPANYARHCTHEIDSPRVEDTWAIGMAWTHWKTTPRWTGTRWVSDWKWTQTIELASGQDDDQLRHTAIHECAHIVQARPIGKSEAAYDASKKAEQKIFAKGAADPQEQQADCMATAITGSTRYNYYTSSCKGSRAKNAKAMWKKWGLKYQNPERSWTTPAT